MSEQEIVTDNFIKHREEVLDKILKALHWRPYTTTELAELLDMSFMNVTRYLSFLLESKEESDPIIEVMNTGKPAYYAIVGHKYDIDLRNDSIKRIPDIWFYQIPIIADWYDYARLNPSRMDDLNTFKNICYGRVVKGWRMNPTKWQHPQTTRAFRKAYVDQYKHELKPHVAQAVKTFLSLCLDLNLSKQKADQYGLKVSGGSGKHRYLKLTLEEIAKADDWLENEGVSVAAQEKIQPEALLAHWSFSLSSFSRPSRLLTIETKSIEKREFRGGTALTWLHFESKQERAKESGGYYPKLIFDKKYVNWAIAWLEHRRELKYDYLFVNNGYEPKVYDSGQLRKEREGFAVIYKELFRYLDKQEPIWYNDTLYCLRHCGIMYWLQKLGPQQAIPLLVSMGYSDYRTLVKFYAGMSGPDMIKALDKMPEDKGIDFNNQFHSLPASG